MPASAMADIWLAAHAAAINAAHGTRRCFGLVLLPDAAPWTCEADDPAEIRALASRAGLGEPYIVALPLAEPMP